MSDTPETDYISSTFIDGVASLKQVWEHARRLERERDEAMMELDSWKAECNRQWVHISNAMHHAIAIQRIQLGSDGDCGADSLASLICEECGIAMSSPLKDP